MNMTNKNRKKVKDKLGKWKDGLLRQKVIAKKLNDQGLMESLLRIEAVLRREIRCITNLEYEDVDLNNLVKNIDHHLHTGF